MISVQYLILSWNHTWNILETILDIALLTCFKLIRLGIQKVLNIKQNVLRQTKKKTNQEENIVYVSTYNPYNGNYSKTVKQTLPHLTEDSHLNIFWGNKIRFNFKFETGAEFKETVDFSLIGTKTISKRCKTCPYNFKS